MGELAHSIFQQIQGTIDSVVTGGGIEAHFRQYAERYRTTRWGIFSDYVIGDRDRPSDTFVFTFAPLGTHLRGIFDLALEKSTPDLKDVKAIPQEMHGILCRLPVLLVLFFAEKRR